MNLLIYAILNISDLHVYNQLKIVPFLIRNLKKIQDFFQWYSILATFPGEYSRRVDESVIVTDRNLSLLDQFIPQRA